MTEQKTSEILIIQIKADAKSGFIHYVSFVLWFMIKTSRNHLNGGKHVNFDCNIFDGRYGLLRNGSRKPAERNPYSIL
uniref:Uncharacterized protein n=1 Tax=Romanomermis culicivorax TaxID=13658 RepID=A0A915HNW7_ROMCU